MSFRGLGPRLDGLLWDVGQSPPSIQPRGLAGCERVCCLATKTRRRGWSNGAVRKRLSRFQGCQMSHGRQKDPCDRPLRSARYYITSLYRSTSGRKHWAQTPITHLSVCTCLLHWIWICVISLFTSLSIPLAQSTSLPLLSLFCMYFSVQFVVSVNVTVLDVK